MLIFSAGPKYRSTRTSTTAQIQPANEAPHLAWRIHCVQPEHHALGVAVRADDPTRIDQYQSSLRTVKLLPCK